jgi:GT2 family glycosyltransferase
VVDNGSTDGSAEMIREKHPDVVLLEQPKNLGFAEGNNAGLEWLGEHSPPDIVVLMNNDTRAAPGWLDALVRALESDAGLGSAASCMVYAADENLVNNAGDIPLCDGAGLARGRHTPVDEYRQDAEVFGACAGAAAYRWEALAAAAMDGKVLDPDYFAYNEDVDLSWRLRRRGWKCRYVAEARIVHHHSATGGRHSTWVLFHGERNRCWTAIKNFSWPYLLASPFYTVWRLLTVLRGSRLAGGTAVGYLKKASLVEIGWTLIRAWCAALIGAPRMIGKRWEHGLGWRHAEQQEVFRRFGARLEDAARH